MVDAKEQTDLDARLGKFESILRRLTDLQAVALMGPERIFRFVYDGKPVAMHLPHADHDFIQHFILRSASFYELHQLRLIAKSGALPRAGTVCDVGANIGNHSVFFGKIIGADQLICVEPQPACVETLRANLALNGLSNASIVEEVMSSKSGSARIEKFVPINHGQTKFRSSEVGSFSVRPLDEVLLNLKRLDLCKIDVEGDVGEVLSGMKETLEKHRPSLWLELIGDERVPITNKLLGLGYSVFPLSPTDWLFRQNVV